MIVVRAVALHQAWLQRQTVVSKWSATVELLDTLIAEAGQIAESRKGSRNIPSLSTIISVFQEQDRKCFDDEAKKKIDRLETEASAVARIIRAGQEDREVQVEEQKDYEAQEVRTVRLDTSEVVHRRAMTPRDLQRPLPLDEAGKKKQPKGEARA